MEKTIEAVWKEGFVDDDALLAPKLNDLYNQKSSNLVDKMTRMFRLNVGALAVFAIVALIGCVVIGLRDLHDLRAINKGCSSYHYIKAFDDWLKANIARFSRIYRFFYPTLFVGSVLGIWFSRHGEKMLKMAIEIHPSIYNGVPIYWALGSRWVPAQVKPMTSTTK